MTDIVVIGAGGFGRETLDVIEAINAHSKKYDVIGVVDDRPSARALRRLSVRGYRHLGSMDDYISLGTNADYVIAVGDPHARRTIAARLEDAGGRAASLIHPSVNLGSQVDLGPGVIIAAGAQVSTNVSLGDHVHVNPSATIGHDTVLSSYVSVNPGSVISGEVVVESEVLIGAGAVVLQGLVIGHGSVIGAAACVTKDVPRGVVVTGVPARVRVSERIDAEREAEVQEA